MKVCVTSPLLVLIYFILLSHGVIDQTNHT